MSGWLSRMRVRFGRRGDADDISEEWLAAMARARSDMESRQQLLIPMAAVVSQISEALFNDDPIGLVADTAVKDEYESEAETIVMRLSKEQRLLDDEDVAMIVHEEFIRWFGADLAGPHDRYTRVAARVASIWNEYLASGY